MTSWMLRKSSMPATPRDFVAAIAGLERQAVEELHDAGDRFAAAEVGDIDAFDRPRRFGELEDFFQAGETLFRIDVEDFGLGVRVELAAAVEASRAGGFRRAGGRLARISAPWRLAPFRPCISASSRILPPSRTRISRSMSLRYSSLLMRRLQGAVHCLMLAAGTGGTSASARRRRRCRGCRCGI